MGHLPSNFRKIRLELAREPGNPEGDSGTGYEFVAPLDDERRIDPDTFELHADACVVRRFVSGTTDKRGRLERNAEGEWYFDYDPASRFDDEAGFRFSSEKFEVGEYISVADEDETLHTYRVTLVDYV